MGKQCWSSSFSLFLDTLKRELQRGQAVRAPSVAALRAETFAVTFPAVSEIKTNPASAPLLLLVRVNALQSWRRLLAVREQSRLLTAVIGLFIVGYLAVSFGLFYHGLKFIAKFPGLGAVLTERLLYVLFAFLFALLLLSNLVISYTNLFRNRETVFLLTLPVSAQTIFRWKFIESTMLASWAFFFLIAPLLAAFGLVRGVPWHFYRGDAGADAVVHRVAGRVGRGAGHLDRTLSGPAQFSSRPSSERPWSCLRWRRFGGRRSRWTTTCSTGARSKRSTNCSPGRGSRCSRFCRVTGSRRPCCNGRRASCAARPFSRWCC